MPLLSQTRPTMTMNSKMKNLIVPKALFKMIPHFRETAWSRHAQVLAAKAMPIILPGVSSCTPNASRIFCANETEFAAVFSRTMNGIPNKHVARKRGLFK